MVVVVASGAVVVVVVGGGVVVVVGGRVVVVVGGRDVVVVGDFGGGARWVVGVLVGPKERVRLTTEFAGSESPAAGLVEMTSPSGRSLWE